MRIAIGAVHVVTPFRLENADGAFGTRLGRFLEFADGFQQIGVAHVLAVVVVGRRKLDHALVAHLDFAHIAGGTNDGTTAVVDGTGAQDAERGRACGFGRDAGRSGSSRRRRRVVFALVGWCGGCNRSIGNQDTDAKTFRLFDFAALLGPLDQRTDGVELTTLLRHEFGKYRLLGGLLDKLGPQPVARKGRGKQGTAAHALDLGILFLTGAAHDVVASGTGNALEFCRFFGLGATHGALEHGSSSTHEVERDVSHTVLGRMSFPRCASALTLTFYVS